MIEAGRVGVVEQSECRENGLWIRVGWVVFEGRAPILGGGATGKRPRTRPEEHEWANT